MIRRSHVGERSCSGKVFFRRAARTRRETALKMPVEFPLNRAHQCVVIIVMSKNTLILMVALCAGVAGLIGFSKSRSGNTALSPDNTPVVAPNTSPGTSSDGTVPGQPGIVTGGNPTAPIPSQGGTVPTATIGQNPHPITANTKPGLDPKMAAGTPGQTLIPPPPKEKPDDKDDVPVAKPLPVLESNYAATTNRDTRLDIMMDIAETPGAETVRTLARLLETETDTDLKVDLIDSLLGIEGHTEEKLAMLTQGARSGLPKEVRLSAVDGLIELNDPRTVAVFNGMLNDPDEEIREAAKDALEMIQAAPPVQLK